MSQQFSIAIDRVVDLLGLERDPRRQKATSYNVRCPFCGDTKYRMNINTEKNTYNCVHCAGEKTGGGALDLYGRVALGTPLIPGKARDGGNGNVLYKQLAEALKIAQPVDFRERIAAQPEVHAIYPASDDALDKCYSALLNLKLFKLTDEHKAKLMKRGLNEESIVRNEYRSVPEDCSWVNGNRKLVKEFRQTGILESLPNHKKIKNREQVIAGYLVGRKLTRLGISMKQVPGFYCVNGHWIFQWEAGMLIPTRNRKGQIVGIQARKDTGNLRYKTLSSKGLPEGVTDGISRVHFPLANSKLEPKTSVYLIEGPLKADVTAHLMGGNSFFAAIQGVNNQNGLADFFEEMKTAGVATLYNAFDMDKLTNSHVAAAGRSLRKKAEKSGIKVKMKLWDEDYARIKWLELMPLCRYHHIKVNMQPDNYFTAVGALAEELHKKGIVHSVTFSADGKPTKHYWSDETKGIDDFLLREKNSQIEKTTC